MKIERARHGTLSAQIEHSEKISGDLPDRSTAKPKIKSRMSHFTSLMRQWIPISKFIAITALINDDHEFVTQPNSIIDGLSQYWSPIFDGSSSTFNSELAQQTLQSLPEPKWDWSRFRVPNVRNCSRV